jgi:hypothetical protein
MKGYKSQFIIIAGFIILILIWNSYRQTPPTAPDLRFWITIITAGMSGLNALLMLVATIIAAASKKMMWAIFGIILTAASAITAIVILTSW